MDWILAIFIMVYVRLEDFDIPVWNNLVLVKENISEKYKDSDYISRMLLWPDERLFPAPDHCLILIVDLPELKNFVSVVKYII